VVGGSILPKRGFRLSEEESVLNISRVFKPIEAAKEGRLFFVVFNRVVLVVADFAGRVVKEQVRDALGERRAPLHRRVLLQRHAVVRDADLLLHLAVAKTAAAARLDHLAVLVVALNARRARRCHVQVHHDRGQDGIRPHTLGPNQLGRKVLEAAHVPVVVERKEKKVFTQPRGPFFVAPCKMIQSISTLSEYVTLPQTEKIGPIPRQDGTAHREKVWVADESERVHVRVDPAPAVLERPLEVDTDLVTEHGLLPEHDKYVQEASVDEREGSRVAFEDADALAHGAQDAMERLLLLPKRRGGAESLEPGGTTKSGSISYSSRPTARALSMLPRTGLINIMRSSILLQELQRESE